MFVERRERQKCYFTGSHARLYNADSSESSQDALRADERRQSSEKKYDDEHDFLPIRDALKKPGSCHLNTEHRSSNG